MFDINTIFAQALAAAVAEAVKPLIERITALENNPAIGVDTTLAARVTQVENEPYDKEALVAYLDQQEWFWEKVSRFVAANSVFDANDLKTLKDRIEELEESVTEERVEELIEQGLDRHCNGYNHDEYDDAVSTINDYDFDDFLTKDELNSELRDQINDTLSNASVSISV